VTNYYAYTAHTMYYSTKSVAFTHKLSCYWTKKVE